MAYRFIHAADVHLDSPLRSLAMRNADLAELIGGATRRAFTATVDLCLADKVDALLLAGDLYDGEQTSMKTALFLGQQMHRLHQAGIRTFVIRGNHDAMSRITNELVLPDTVRVFGGHAETVEIDGVGGGPRVAFHGISFRHHHAPDSLLPRYRPPVPDTVNVGLMHTSLGGASGHDDYAPCAEADLQASGFRYWALGHVHRRAIYEGGCTVVMPGMPQGRDVGEPGPKSVSLVTVRDDGAIEIEERHTSIAEFERVRVDVSGCRDWAAVVTRIGAGLRAARERARSDHLVARVTVYGATALAWRIRRDADLLRTEAEQQASMLGRTWIDKVELDCGRGAGAEGGGAVEELRRLIGGEVLESEAFRVEVAAIAQELLAQLPPECRDAIGADGQASEALLAELSREGSEDVLARLSGHPDGEGM